MLPSPSQWGKCESPHVPTRPNAWWWHPVPGSRALVCRLLGGANTNCACSSQQKRPLSALHERASITADQVHLARAAAEPRRSHWSGLTSPLGAGKLSSITDIDHSKGACDDHPRGGQTSWGFNRHSFALLTRRPGSFRRGHSPNGPRTRVFATGGCPESQDRNLVRHRRRRAGCGKPLLRCFGQGYRVRFSAWSLQCFPR